MKNKFKLLVSVLVMNLLMAGIVSAITTELIYVGISPQPKILQYESCICSDENGYIGYLIQVGSECVCPDPIFNIVPPEEIPIIYPLTPEEYQTLPSYLIYELPEDQEEFIIITQTEEETNEVPLNFNHPDTEFIHYLIEDKNDEENTLVIPIEEPVEIDDDENIETSTEQQTEINQIEIDDDENIETDSLFIDDSNTISHVFIDDSNVNPVFIANSNTIPVYTAPQTIFEKIKLEVKDFITFLFKE